MCHSHRSSLLTSAQTFVFPKEYIYLTKPHTRRLDVHHPARRVLGLCLDRISIAMRHAPCGIQAIASLNRARWGDNVYIPVHKGWVGAGCNNRRTQPHYWAKSDTYSKAPVSNRAHNTTNGILRFLVTCRAADFNNLDLHHPTFARWTPGSGRFTSRYISIPYSHATRLQARHYLKKCCICL